MSEAVICDLVGPSVADLAVLLAALGCPSPVSDDPGRVDRIAMLERVKSAAAAAQAREAVAFRTSQLAAQRAAGVSSRRLGGGIGAQLALARRESPAQGARLMGLADVLVHELPHTLAAMTAGEVSEWRATLVARETACLSRADRATVDARLAGRLAELSTGQVVAQARRHAYQLDPASFTARSSRAARDRRVTIRPAPDTMALVTALLPVAQGVAAYAALCRHADAARSHGDPRSRGQLMADTLVERVTGQADAGQVPVEIQLLITDQTLFTGDPTPAVITGYGPIPAPYARRLLRDLHPDTHTWIRRLFTDPATGKLTGIDTTRRRFDGALRRQIIARDQTCRTPGAAPPSATSTTPPPTPPAAPPPNPTDKDFAKPATTPKKPPAGPANQPPKEPATTSPPPPQPDTPTPADPHPSPAPHQTKTNTHRPAAPQRQPSRTTQSPHP